MCVYIYMCYIINMYKLYTSKWYVNVYTHYIIGFSCWFIPGDDKKTGRRRRCRWHHVL